MNSNWLGNLDDQPMKETGLPQISTDGQFIEYAHQKRQALSDELTNIRSQIGELQRQENDLQRKVDAFDVILGVSGKPRPAPDTSPSIDQERVATHSVPRRKSKQAMERANAVVNFLQEIYPESMHFREIYRHMELRGVRTNSADGANALLAAYSDDERLERLMRGTYRANLSA